MDEEEVPHAYRRIDELGLTVPVGIRLPAGDGTGEIVKTYADCAITAVFYRSDWRAMPHVLEPSEIAGGSGGMVGDLRVFRHDPVAPDRQRITVSFEGFAAWDEGELIPVDRTRTALFDRYLRDAVPREEIEGVGVEVVDVRAGLLRTSIELFIRATDPEILALQLDRSGFRPMHVSGGPGDPRLWREWHPSASPAQRKEVRESGGRVTKTVSAGLSVRARRLTPKEIAALPPRKDPPPEWTATAQPGTVPLAMQGGSGRGGEPPERPEIRPILYCAEAPDSATSIDLSLDRLWAYRFDHASARVPPPRSDAAVDLSGFRLEGSTCSVHLRRWESTEHGFTLIATSDPPEVWPDVRVMSDASSASLWTSPPDEGELRFGLPLSYARLFDEPAVEIALRMVARRLSPIRLALPLTAAGEGPAR